ncbi:MAG: hypothetical protein QOF07_1042 [Bradyrhizobium sp.]|nr:hypothetical protein [Bradyrhizobium sp.]
MPLRIGHAALTHRQLRPGAAPPTQVEWALPPAAWRILAAAGWRRGPALACPRAAASSMAPARSAAEAAREARRLAWPMAPVSALALARSAAGAARCLARSMARVRGQARSFAEAEEPARRPARRAASVQASAQACAQAFAPASVQAVARGRVRRPAARGGRVPRLALPGPSAQQAAARPPEEPGARDAAVGLRPAAPGAAEPEPAAAAEVSGAEAVPRPEAAGPAWAQEARAAPDAAAVRLRAAPAWVLLLAPASELPSASPSPSLQGWVRPRLAPPPAVRSARATAQP